MEKVEELKEFIRGLNGTAYRFFFIQDSATRAWRAECEGKEKRKWEIGKVDHKEMFRLADMCTDNGYNALLVRM